MQVHTDKTVTMPAGEYWVGDPCYSVPRRHWKGWLESADYLNEPKCLAAEINGWEIVGMKTAHGDGVYIDNEGNEYPVDAGLIGVVPVEAVEADGQNPEGLSTLITFPDPFTISEGDGVITIGHLTIDTDWEGEPLD